MPASAAVFAIPELLDLILAFLPPASLFFAGRVSRSWRAIAQRRAALRPRWGCAQLVALCISEGSVAHAEQAIALGCSADERACALAAKDGHLSILQLLRTHNTPWDEKTCANAAGGGHLELLQWARDHEAPWDWCVCAYAAGGGHLELLQWARSQECPWGEDACAFAALGGHLEVLQWAREHGASWTYNTCAFAAGGRHLELLRWAHARGAPWDACTGCERATLAGHHARR